MAAVTGLPARCVPRNARGFWRHLTSASRIARQPLFKRRCSMKESIVRQTKQRKSNSIARNSPRHQIM
jgi:hypothetical protein